MKALNFGSVNIDFTYRVAHFIRPGETFSVRSVTSNAGGKESLMLADWIILNETGPRN